MGSNDYNKSLDQEEQQIIKWIVITLLVIFVIAVIGSCTQCGGTASTPVPVVVSGNQSPGGYAPTVVVPNNSGDHFWSNMMLYHLFTVGNSNTRTIERHYYGSNDSPNPTPTAASRTSSYSSGFFRLDSAPSASRSYSKSYSMPSTSTSTSNSYSRSGSFGSRSTTSGSSYKSSGSFSGSRSTSSGGSYRSSGGFRK